MVSGISGSNQVVEMSVSEGLTDQLGVDGATESRGAIHTAYPHELPSAGGSVTACSSITCPDASNARTVTGNPSGLDELRFPDA